MFIHYFIILYSSTVIFSSINHCSSIKSRHRKTNFKIIDESNSTNTRLPRDLLREDRDNVNFYSDNDGRYFRNQPEELTEPKRAYYLPKMSMQS
jgi:hypothetical protein